MPSTERKKNRLAGYDYSQPGAYFITVCVKDHRCLLSNVVGADDHIGPYVALTEIGKIVEKYTRSIPGVAEYVIMPNHVHMILRISGKDAAQGPMWSSAPTGKRIENLVRSWKTLISKELGQHVWQRSYYDHIIRDEQDYVIRAQYIINNPAKWHEDKYYSP